jgi:hypothetical protein
MKSDAVRFRKWMRELTLNPYPRDAGSEYLDSIAGDKSLFESLPGRAIKTLTVSALFGIVGASVAGPVGAKLGAVGGFAIDATLDLIDEFVLGGILSGWKPRSYFDNVLYPTGRDAT